MLFNSIHFLIFFVIVIIVYFSIPKEYRWVLLLFTSYYFYMSWKAEYIILIIISTLVDYFVGLKIGKEKNERLRKILLYLSLTANLGLLFMFKYFNFVADSVRDFLSMVSIDFTPLHLNVLLPVGISFYTFQTLSYTIDVYRRKIAPEKHLGIFAVYVSFFPQLVAGPIERAKNLLPQFYEKHNFSYTQVTDGLKLMLWGFFKKLVIADRLAFFVDHVYATPAEFNSTYLIIATVFFAYQIYCDFSGYSDIAIGAAQVMGYKLMDNFKRPYFSKSISEFWNRWHISLSSWFKDYVYTPLLGRKISMARLYVSLFVTFVVSGVWHGANWTFLFWGVLHGLYLVASILTTRVRKKMVNLIGLNKYPLLHSAFKILFVFILVNIGWILFRANSISDAWYIFTHLFTDLNFNITSMRFGVVDRYDFIIGILAIIFMEFVHTIQEHTKMRAFMRDKPIWVRWPVYATLVLSILLFGVFKDISFIYFQF